MAADSSVEHRRFDAPDETRRWPLGRKEILTIGGVTLARVTFEPGYHWAEHSKPHAGTDLCMVPHLRYVISGRMGVRLESGDELEVGAGEAVWLGPGHDLWVVGDDPYVALDVMAVAEDARIVS